MGEHSADEGSIPSSSTTTTVELVGVRPTGLPLALAELHRVTPVGGHLALRLPVAVLAAELVTGAGFDVERVVPGGGDGGGAGSAVHATRARTLPDFVGPGMGVLVCGLNPSLVAADAGFGYAGPTNRFWPAAVASGLVTRPRDPVHAVTEDHVGMTDLVKRATPGAGVLAREEYQAGAERVARLVDWLRPSVVLFVGLAGWRAAVDRRATPGVQPEPFAGATAYVMPSTSGLNAHSRLADLTAHMVRARTAAGLQTS
ncbi:MAG: mismatch-specific DNA-glycosylase [Actinomycetota bacterium]|nr:mismatch-specific DNA-glycosylase [Actinomycetota bacterium]